MKTRPQEVGARRVQPSGRPSGAPYGLDAPAGLWERLGSAGTGGFARLFQTPEHNLIRPEIGPTVGDHFKHPDLPSAGSRKARFIRIVACQHRSGTHVNLPV